MAGSVAGACAPTGNEVAIESAGSASEFDFDYRIPAGTGERMDAGEQVEILPRDISASVGDQIRVVNDDDRGHTVGWMYVGPGEVVTQRFTSTGEFVGVCTVHPSGEVRLVVHE